MSLAAVLAIRLRSDRSRILNSSNSSSPTTTVPPLSRDILRRSDTGRDVAVAHRPSCSRWLGVARTSRDGDRVEPAALTAGSITLRNGACHVSGLPRPGRHTPNEPRCDDQTQTRPQEPLTVATRSRQLVDLDHRHTSSLTGSYGAMWCLRSAVSSNPFYENSGCRSRTRSAR
jgi:hypothetical protein